MHVARTFLCQTSNMYQITCMESFKGTLMTCAHGSRAQSRLAHRRSMSQTIPPSFAAFQSAPRRHRVIPPAAVAVAVDAPQLPSPLPPPPPSEDKRPRHRHAAALEEALQLLKTLSAQADHPVVVEEDEDDEEVRWASPNPTPESELSS